MAKKKTTLEWAEEKLTPNQFIKFVDNCNKQCPGILGMKQATWEEALIGAFIFSETDEGFHYWNEIRQITST